MPKDLPGAFVCHPAVCAVEENYVLLLPVRFPALVHLKIGSRVFYETDGGVRVSSARLHRFVVPQAVLDAAGAYTVCWQRVHLRLPFACLRASLRQKSYAFRPVSSAQAVHICHIADCHGMRRAPAEAARFFGDQLDLLLLNGDIQDFSGTYRQAILPLCLASDITGGTRPVLLTRGNHDLRGAFADRLHTVMPSPVPYYWARLGPVAFLVLDTGEDKVDSHREYGGTAAYHPYRLEETAFLEETAASAKMHGADVRYRFAVAHVPFGIRNLEDWGSEKRPFDIENDLYTHWAQVLNDTFRPHFFLAGHFHGAEVLAPGADCPGHGVARGLRCSTLIGGLPKKKEKDYIAAHITVRPDGCTVAFAGRDGRVLQTQEVAYPDDV